MPDIRLIASDMDGTLLDAQGRISPRTLSALRKAQEKGRDIHHVHRTFSYALLRPGARRGAELLDYRLQRRLGI